MQNSKSKKIEFTNSVQLPLQNCQPKFSSINEIVGWLVDVRIKFAFPDYSERKFASSRLGISESDLSLIISGERPINAAKFFLLINIAKAPEVFTMLREYTFPDELIIRGQIK